MLEELSHIDRITQLQDEIQQLLTIMSSTSPPVPISSKSVPQIPITKQRNPDKYDTPDVFEANQKALVTDLIVKAKQVEHLIKSLPEVEPEEDQLGACLRLLAPAERLRILDAEMTNVNDEYIRAVARSKDLHGQVVDMLRLMLGDTDTRLVEAPR
ncbi:hypothetical protein C8J57DRAFT_1067019 [Mycena rebaudengoi]|nr:hypothetical protein C8J57DRAFT_1067019 [Mycena rebaudengoi]